MNRLFALLCVAVLGAGPAGAESLLDAAATEDPALHRVVREAALGALLHDLSRLDAAVAASVAFDAEREAAKQAPTGLTDNVRLMAGALRPTRAARRDALEAVLDDDPDPVVERIATFAREQEDDAEAADDLLADDRHNRRASLLNDAVRPFGVFSGTAVLAAVNPFLLAGSAVDSLVTTVVNLYHYTDLSPREREALVRYRRQFARDPDAARQPEWRELVGAITARRSAALCEDSVDEAERALESSDLDRAAFYVTDARHLPGCAERVAAIGTELDEASAMQRRTAEAARWPADDLQHPDGAERADYRAVAVATALGKPAQMAVAAGTFVERHPTSRHRSAVALTAALARDLSGHRDESLAALEEVADEDDGAGRLAAALAVSGYFDRLQALDAAESRHAREVAQYVLVGGGPDGRTALYTAAQVGAQGIAAAESFGIFNVIGMMSRAWSAWRKDPASNQTIIDEGERFLARTPDAPEASEVHERLATAYERAGAYDRALLHYRAVTSPDPERVIDLEEQIADQLLENAEKAGGEPALLGALVHFYPSTEAGEKARKALDAMPKATELPISKEVLASQPELLGPNALDLEATLLDDRRENGELAEAGVTVTADGLTLSLEDPDGDGVRKEHRSRDADAASRARAAGERAMYARLLTADPAQAESGRFERYIPVFLTGSIGDSGVSVAPGIKLRRHRSEDQALYE